MRIPKLKTIVGSVSDFGFVVSIFFRISRRLGFGLLLLALPACGLSDYEAKTLETQQRAERFDKEQKYLDEPVQMPTTPDKDGKEVKVADVFFRPPKGIGPKPAHLGNQLWRYARTGKSDFVRVEMAFATEAKDFAQDVMRNYQAAENFQAPQHESFDTWEFNDADNGYSVNVHKGGRTQVAIVYVFARGQRDNLRTAMDLSLQSLAVDQKAAAARQKYGDKSPWRLKPAP
ncbi:MAG TPA: hypothetical protein VH643_08045 [Gemmataceae bacterium]